MSRYNYKSEKEYSISFIRLLAFCFIVACHIMQFLELELAFWFNVGVQVYLCISGYLYGQRDIDDTIRFYHKRFKRILIPYYIVIIPVILLQFVFASSFINPILAVKVMFLNDTLRGGGHLWFISTILFCYAITPLINKFIRNEVNKNRYIIKTLISLEICTLFCGAFATFYHPAWICCFIIGYVIGVNKYRSFYKRKSIMIIFVLLSLQNIVQIFLDYVIGIELSGTIGAFYMLWSRYNHVWLGVLLFIIGQDVFERINYSKHLKLVSAFELSDYYNYEAYLVHQFIILGPFSLMMITDHLWINIIIVIIGIIVLTLLLKRIENCLPFRKERQNA